jgi:hypothetical protein
MDIDDLPIERIFLLLWCILELFTDKFNFFPYNMEMKIFAVVVLLILAIISYVSYRSKVWDERKKFTPADYIMLMESKGFHFTEEQKEKAGKEK